MRAFGNITDVTPGEGFNVYVPFPDTRLVEKMMLDQCEIKLDDGRRISAKQRNTVFSLISDITAYVSNPPAAKRKQAEIEMLREMQLLYLIDLSDSEAVRRQLTMHFCSLSQIDCFSLSDIDMTTAREFIDWLVEICVQHGIPCNDTLLNRCEDVGRYLYACVAARRCAICGKKADIHEVDVVGMGRNRRKIHHAGQRVQPLCRLHHSELGTLGQQRFDERYHMEAVRLDEHLCKVLGWKI